MKHFAIIADGNRRWATANGLPKCVGYPQGLVTIEKCCIWALERGIQYLTFYCFSTENWSRPANEVNALMDLARDYFDNKKEWYRCMGIRVVFSGRRDRFPEDVVRNLVVTEKHTADCKMMTLVICCDYGGRDEIVRAVTNGARTESEITAALNTFAPDPDIILRTGGQKRLSNFLLWQSAYAELFFSDTLFPALSTDELDAICLQYEGRTRNFGS